MESRPAAPSERKSMQAKGYYGKKVTEERNRDQMKNWLGHIFSWDLHVFHLMAAYPISMSDNSCGIKLNFVLSLILKSERHFIQTLYIIDILSMYVNFRVAEPEAAKAWILLWYCIYANVFHVSIHGWMLKQVQIILLCLNHVGTLDYLCTSNFLTCKSDLVLLMCHL